jgi:hypothetical protein
MAISAQTKNKQAPLANAVVSTSKHNPAFVHATCLPYAKCYIQVISPYQLQSRNENLIKRPITLKSAMALLHPYERK